MEVKIYQPSKVSTQSRKKSGAWLLELNLKDNYKSIDNLMGWTCSSNTLSQVKLKFVNLEDAVCYAKKQGWSYEVIIPQVAKIFGKSYADNFK